jgi:soluble lytic murein transglycosylase-like protein
MKLGRTIIAAALLFVAALACAADPDPELREVLRAAASESPSFTDRFDAEVWLTDMSRRLERQVGDPDERIEMLTLVHMEAKRVDLPPELILAVIEVESNFDRYAVSVAGALGLMQIMPFWIRSCASITTRKTATCGARSVATTAVWANENTRTR